MLPTGGADEAPAMLVGSPAAVPTGEANGLFAGPEDDPDRFELVGAGVQGGEGTVWRARYRGRLASPVIYAVKMLAPPPGAPAGWPSAAEEQRWQDQRHLLRGVSNTHLVGLHDVFAGPAPHRCGGGAGAATRPYVVMEWIDGQLLHDRIRAGGATALERLGYVRDLADAVQALHSATSTQGNPMVHRDIKPANCVVHPSRGAVLIDLGTLRAEADGFDPHGMHSRPFAAPEVLAAPHEPRRPESDLYSLGAVAFFCITGAEPPGTAEDVTDELNAALRAQGVRRPAALATHLARMLAADPAQRPGRPALWADQATAIADHRRRRRRRVLAMTYVVVAALLAMAGMKIYHLLPHSGPAAEVSAFAPFGTEFDPFPYRVAGTSLSISAPTGDDRYSHLYGLYAPGGACATTLEFDATVSGGNSEHGYGFAVAPRAELQDGQPTGASIQYEWQAGDITDRPGYYLRPAQLPGGAWAGTTDPAPAPAFTTPVHVRVSSVGETIRMTVGAVSVAYAVPDVECGGIAIRAWGAKLALTEVTVARS
jgi:hypothetical protein